MEAKTLDTGATKLDSRGHSAKTGRDFEFDRQEKIRALADLC